MRSLLVVISAVLLLTLGRLANAQPADAAATVPETDATGGAGLPTLRPAPDLSQLGDRPIQSVRVELVGNQWREQVTLESVKSGQPATAATARRAMRELLDTGRFADVSANFVGKADGVVLVVRAIPRRLIADIRLSGSSLDTREVLREIGLKEGDEITEPRMAELSSDLIRYHRERGFADTKVTLETGETDAPGEVLLRIDIQSGRSRIIAQRVFVIDPAADREVGPLKRAYLVESDDRADEVALREADRALTDELRSVGFYRASVSHVVLDHEGHTYLYVYLQTGPRIVPVFDGNRTYDDDELRDALGLEKDKQDTKPSVLTERLRKYYVDRGFYDIDIQSEERGTADAPVHFLVFTIRENQRVRVARRVFSCLPPEFDADEIGGEIDSFLDEELPSDSIIAPDGEVTNQTFGPTQGSGGRAPARTLNPESTYAPVTYERAVAHVRDLFYSRGYLNAEIGPVAVVRARCNRDSPPGTCVADPLPQKLGAECRLDQLGLPLPEPPIADSLTCEPDARKDLQCAPDLTLRIPMHLGPQTTLYDVVFEGKDIGPPFPLALVAGLKLGAPLSTVDLETARQNILDLYKNQGHYYAEVQMTIEPSPDRTRARVRFSVLPREPVIVSGFVIRGATRTDHDLILGRLALENGKPYRAPWVRDSEERIATLGTFTSVAIGLEDPDVPQRNKRVIITVSEQLPQFLEVKPGFSTGEGVRFGVEFGHRNIAAQAISLTLRLKLSYLFDFMIVDEDFKENIATLPVSQQLERQNSANLTFPEIGLGPLISFSIEALDVRDNQRDFGLTRQAFGPSLTYRPIRQVATTLGASVELNDVEVFNADSVNEAIRQNRSLENLLRVPDGRTFAVAQRLTVTWDRRDNPFSATQGTFLTSGVEHVNAFPADAVEAGDNAVESHFLKLTSRFAGYIRLTRKGLAIAMSVEGGYNLQLNADSLTYPDRLFFQGGVDSNRAFLTDSVVPEDVAQRILNPEPGEEALTIDDLGIRGGDVEINPRVELRVPLNDSFQLGFFADLGNVWVDPAAIDLLAMRYGAGAGLRWNTFIGPLAFDYGINLDRRPWEDFGAFHFSIGLF